MSKKVFYSEYGENNGYNVIKKKFGRGFKVTKYGKKITKENGLDIAKTDDDEFIILHNNLDGKGTKEVAFYGTNNYFNQSKKTRRNSFSSSSSSQSSSPDRITSAVLERVPFDTTKKGKGNLKIREKTYDPHREQINDNIFGPLSNKLTHRTTTATTFEDDLKVMFGKTRKSKKPSKTRKPKIPKAPKASFKKISKSSRKSSKRKSLKKSKKSKRKSSKRSSRKR